MMYKKEEIKKHFEDFLENHDQEWIEENIDDIHNHAFNEDYFIIGTYQAEQWLADHVFEVIGIIQDYEDLQFGERFIDLGDSEKVVNMYAYIVGEEVVNEWLEDRRELEVLTDPTPVEIEQAVEVGNE